ncbi:MAG: 1-deoxy-D-xylulose-5-phosphate reductoisomerase [Dehalococcoidales bacterium]|nr:1-deoxy-D-xylulose-5-phosphate reductoisomerase [Dehalococcoidales bacterium]
MGNTVKNLAVLGSTGSIGRQTLDVIRALSANFKVKALAAGHNTGLLCEQIREFKPEFVYHLGDTSASADTGCTFMSPEEMACHPDIDTIVIATSGKAGLKATLAAVRAGKNVALSNKESLVMAGEIIMAEAKRCKATILPVDSEHSAIWQCLRGETEPASIILTASGGPFKGYSREKLAEVTPEQALNHPSWLMGKKVTIDSATLMNKGLEIIEARWLFEVPVEKINVVIHPQSIIHSMVEFADGSVKAQLSYPDMRMPIQYALTWPERLPNPTLRRVEWQTMRDLTFDKPDYETFPCLRIAIEAIGEGKTYPAALCAADEEAVELFLSGKIRFTDIPRLVEKVIDKHEPVDKASIDDIMAADEWARETVLRLYSDKHL